MFTVKSLNPPFLNPPYQIRERFRTFLPVVVDVETGGFNPATDALLYCQNFCTLAEAEGLGLCYLGTTLYQPSAIAEVLGLPKLVVPVATITLGWPAEHPEQTDRLPLSAIIHDEHYTDYTPQAIDDAYRDKEALEVNRQFVRENGKETLAQVFTDVRYTRRDNEALSAGLLDVLRRQGFLD